MLRTPYVALSRVRAITLLLLAAGSALLACGGLRSAGGSDESDASTGQVSSSSGTSSSGGSAREGGNDAPPCPAGPPWPGQPCAQVGQECDYSGPGGGYCGNVRAVCAIQGYWQSSGEQCPPADCPSALPASGQSCTQQGLTCRYPLNALTCDGGGVCGTGLTCGTLGCTNANGAVCDEWDCTCGGGASWTCGAGDCLGGDAGVGCDYDAGNDPRCPAAYSPLGCYSACAPVGLSCLYPGAGDIPLGNGCQSAASLSCVSNAREAGSCAPCWDAGQWTCPTFDAGADVEVGHWLSLQ